MICFNELGFRNFLSYGNQMTVIHLNEHHSTLLHGDSGSGKSTFLDALSFVLFSKPFRDINKSQLVNTANVKDCVSYVCFTSNGDEYKVIRGLKPNIFEIYKNGILQNQDSHSRDYQEILEKQILGFNFKTFKQVVVLGAANFTPFMQLKPPDRRLIVEELLDIKIFSIMNLLLKQQMVDIRTKLSDLDLRYSNTEDKISLVKKFSAEMKKNLVENLEESNRTKLEKKLQLIDLEDQLSDLESPIKDKEEQYKKLKKTVSDNIINMKRYQAKLDFYINTQIERLKFFEKFESCPTCNQTVDQHFRNDKILSYQRKIDKLTSAINTVILPKLNSLREKDQLINEFGDKIQKSTEKLLNKRAEIRSIQSQLLSLDSSIRSIEFKLKEFDKDENNQELVLLEDQLKELISDKEACLEFRLVADVASNLLRDAGIKSRIIKQYLPYINKCVNKYLTVMNFYISFVMDENFNETIKVRGNDNYTYFSFSEGEKQRLDLALLFTWRQIAKLKNSVNTNLLIMDEVFDSYLDQSATENVIELLNSDLFKENNIFIISHKDTILDKFDKTLNFKKVKGFSEIS
jgi:DNA repair exonuclease SbcCD ATPase subunit